MKKLKLALISDIHHGVNSYVQYGHKALELLEKFVAEVNTQDVDMVIDLGDRINDVDRDTDLQREREVAAIFKQLTVPHVHLLGNHDMQLLSRSDNAQALGKTVEHQSCDLKGIHLVFWQPDVYFFKGFHANQAQLDWLRKDLRRTDLPSIIFTHAPFSGASMMSHFYFQNAPSNQAGYDNGAEIRELIRSEGHVIACFSGHVHWNSWQCISGTHHITVQSLTESWTSQNEVAETWAYLSVSDQLQLEINGNDPLHLILPIKPKHHPWREPMLFE